MTWLGQVVHVARKDAREQAWPLRAYIVVTALAALTLFSQRWIGFANAFAMAVFLFGTILVASVVQTDSPTSSDSFWGSRPLRPAAMLGAKLLLAAIFVLVPAIAQWVALSAVDVDSREAFVAIVQSSTTYVVWLLAAMAIAGLTRDVRIFLVSFAVILVAIGFTQSLWEDAHYWPVRTNLDTGDIALGTPGLWTAIAICGAVALVLFLYQRRDSRRRMWIAAIAVVVSALSGTFMSGPAKAHGTNVTTALRIPVRVELLRSERLGMDDKINLRVAAAGDAGSRRVLLYPQRVTIRVRGGAPVIIWGTWDSNSIVAAGNPLGAGIQWLPGEADSFSYFSLPLSPEQRAAIAKGVIGLEVEGSVHVLESRTIGMLPVGPNRSSTRHGTRLHILSVTPAPDGGTLSVQSATALQSQPTSFFTDRLRALTGRQYAFVNESHGEAVYPYTTGTSDKTDMSLVLPSMPLLNETTTLQMKAFGGTVRDAAWFVGARLALVEWTQVGSYDVRVPIVQVPTPPELRPRDSTIQRSGNSVAQPAPSP